jgi:hypothetical protein
MMLSKKSTWVNMMIFQKIGPRDDLGCPWLQCCPNFWSRTQMNEILSFDKNNKMAVLSLDNTATGDVKFLEPESSWAHNDKKMSRN